MKEPRDHIYVLATYRIKRKGDNWFIGKTNYDIWQGPYRTLRHATTAIAPLLEREWTNRHKAICDYHKWDVT